MDRPEPYVIYIGKQSDKAAGLGYCNRKTFVIRNGFAYRKNRMGICRHNFFQKSWMFQRKIYLCSQLFTNFIH